MLVGPDPEMPPASCLGGGDPDPNPGELAMRRKEHISKTIGLHQINPQLVPRQRYLTSLSELVVARDVTLSPNEAEVVYLYAQTDVKGPNRSVEPVADTIFRKTFPELYDGCSETVDFVCSHQSLYKLTFVKLLNTTSKPVEILAGTHYGYLSSPEGYDPEWFHLQHADPASVNRIMTDESQRLSMEDRGDCDWLDDGRSAASEDDLPEMLPDETSLPEVTGVEFEGLGSTVVKFKVKKDPHQEQTFEEGGPAQNAHDLAQMNVDLSQSRDLGAKDQPLLSQNPEQMDLVVDTLLEIQSVFTRNAKVPHSARHPLAVVPIPTGDTSPIKQKPYPIPTKYREAVRAEIEGLVRAGLIQPGYSDWCSPVLCVLKRIPPLMTSSLKLRWISDG